jgi:hypothetical protein
MSSVTPEEIEIYKNVNIASYATCVSGLLVWVALLAWILFKKAELGGLILICTLMIVFFISTIITVQA